MMILVFLMEKKKQKATWEVGGERARFVWEGEKSEVAECKRDARSRLRLQPAEGKRQKHLFASYLSIRYR